MMRFFKNANYPFVEIRKYSYAISIILILASVIGIIVNGFNWSIDFTGGVAAKLDLTALDSSIPKVQIDELRDALKNHGYPEAEIQHVGAVENSDFMIKIKRSEEGVDAKGKIIDVIRENFPKHVEGRDITNEVIAEIYEVGPKVGGELRRDALIAVGIALILMSIYIWFRFELIFGLMAIVALAHDVLIVMGVFALSGKEMTVQIIAALLTIVGYSINDTIVVFDRIREALKVRRKEPLDKVINDSINSTLSRTSITSLTTFLATISLYIFGGQVLRDFALAMSLGVVVGTYSSVMISSNLVRDFGKMLKSEKAIVQHLAKKK